MIEAYRKPLAHRPEKTQVRRSFGRAAHTYDGLAGLQRDVADDLLRKLPAPGHWIMTVVDVGCGTGYCTEQLAARVHCESIVALDIAPEMLGMARRRISSAFVRYICGDAECLPLATSSADLVVSNLALQWCCDPEVVFREFSRVLKPGGTLLFSTFGPATLWEMRQAWQAADDYSHVNEFFSPRDISVAMNAAGMGGIAVTAERRVATYPDVVALMRELKGIGAHNVTGGRPRHMVGKGAYQRMLSAYGALRVDDSIPATFEVIHASGEKTQP